jgi:DUF971 family protein
MSYVCKDYVPSESAEPDSLPRIAVTPAKVRVRLTEGTGMEIDWADGHRSVWSFAWLRAACPCTTCVEERKQEGRKLGQPQPAPAALLPLYTPPPKPTGAHAVGHYAIQFDWLDGHSGGLYSWKYLRRHCQCRECAFATVEATGAPN